MKSLMRWDPFRMMRSFDPFDELRSMQKEMDRLFERFLGSETAREGETGLWMPTVESFTRDGRLVIRAELPGIEAKDLDVSVTEHELVIKGERKAEKDEKTKDYAYSEISYGSFVRRFPLPGGAKADELKADFTNGLLEITVPVPTAAKARKIEIGTRDVGKIEAEPKVKKAA